MKSFLHLLGALATGVALVVAEAEVDVDETCESDDYVSSPTSDAIVVAAVASQNTDSTPSSVFTHPLEDAKHVFAPHVNPNTDRHDLSYTKPHWNVSLYYSSNTTQQSSMKVKHEMKYPTVVLEQIAYVSNVDCTNVSVAVTFNDSSVFQSTQASWASTGKFVMITNHLGDCDPELKRGFFLVENISFDNKTLVALASSAGTNVSSTAVQTEITFGNIAAATNLTARAIGDATIDPSYNIAKTFTIAENQVLYTLGDYLSVSTAETATLAADVTFSGYLKYNWITWKTEAFYFDIDADLSADLTLSANIAAQYNTTFSYTPAVLYYGVSVPGILEIGPQLQFGVQAFVGASAKAVVTTELSAAIPDGKVHVDLLNKGLTTTSGWDKPTYDAKINVTAEVAAQINPAVVLTVEIAVDFFNGLLDLSTGITATAGFENSLLLSAAAGVDLKGVENVTSTGTCAQGLKLESDFVFDVMAFVTQFYSVDLYSVDIPLYDQCFSWQK